MDRQRRYLGTRARGFIALATLALALAPMISRGFSGYSIMKGNGYDKFTKPTAAERSAWKSGGYGWVGVYLGGSNYIGSPITAAWAMDAVNNSKVGLALIWVDLQSQCWSGSGAKFSNTTTMAASQGATAATTATNAAKGAGFTGSVPIYLDVEGHSGSSTCRAAARAFVDGFVKQVRANGFYAGVYGSAGSSYLSEFVGIANTPDYIWAARVNNTVSVFDLDTYIADDVWMYNQRLRQHTLNTTKTVNGVTMTVDLNCAAGRVGPAGVASIENPACYSN